ncbi:MAG: hypothetical protein KGL12_01545 [Rhodospirillales bacterium]|nr:hypothetical protein [Rhodospirillales bacterium]
MSISSLAAGQVANPVIPALVLNSTTTPAGPFTLPGTGGAGSTGSPGGTSSGGTSPSGTSPSGTSQGVGATSSLATSLAGSLSGALNAALLQLQQGAGSAGQAGQAANPLGTPAIGGPHHHHHRADTDRPANGALGASQGVGQGQTADAAAVSGVGTTPSGAGGLLLGDMTQALQTYTANGGVSLG